MFHANRGRFALPLSGARGTHSRVRGEHRMAYGLIYIAGIGFGLGLGFQTRWVHFTMQKCPIGSEF